MTAEVTFAQVAKQHPQNLQYSILAFDPGETMGWAFLRGGVVLESGQLRTAEWTNVQLKTVVDLIQRTRPDVIVYETYLVYSWKTDQHAWNEVHTAQIIGALRYCCVRMGIPYAKQTAQIAKQFCTDDRMISWGLWKKGQRHARDAIRHGIYWTLFGEYAKLYTSCGASDPKKLS